MFNLTIVSPDGRKIERDLTGKETVVGRHDGCDVRLDDGLISRNHCLILLEGRRVVVKDLESRNGTWVNGRRILNRREIRPGDVLQVGTFRLHFYLEKTLPAVQDAETPGEEPTADEAVVRSGEAQPVVEPLGIISDYLSETTGHFGEAPTRIRRERISRNLLTLYRMTEELVALEKDPAEILDYVLDEIFEVFSPSQATILLSGDDDIPVPAKQRSEHGDKNIRTVSATIVNRVLADRVSILTHNAAEDPRFCEGDSVVLDAIGSAMAAPVWEGRSILGVLYVDSLDTVGGFGKEDLDLLTAMGHQVALAIQRRRLTERLREEAVKNAVIRESLGRFHSPQVVDLILEGAADLGAKETVATIFFCDIVHFTQLCTSAPLSRLQEVLNLFFKTVNEVVFDERGTLDKYLGDGAMAIFGAPLDQEDAPVRAVRSALRIREALAVAMSELPAELRFRVRYGINTGNAIVGNFGSDERVDYTILGHAVNLASRICESAAPDQILIGSHTFHDVEDRKLFEAIRLGSKRFKGIKGSETLYEIIGNR